MSDKQNISVHIPGGGTSASWTNGYLEEISKDHNITNAIVSSAGVIPILMYAAARIKGIEMGDLVKELKGLNNFNLFNWGALKQFMLNNKGFVAKNFFQILRGNIDIDKVQFEGTPLWNPKKYIEVFDKIFTITNEDGSKRHMTLADLPSDLNLIIQFSIDFIPKNGSPLKLEEGHTLPQSVLDILYPNLDEDANLYMQFTEPQNRFPFFLHLSEYLKTRGENEADETKLSELLVAAMCFPGLLSTEWARRLAERILGHSLDEIARAFGGEVTAELVDESDNPTPEILDGDLIIELMESYEYGSHAERVLHTPTQLAIALLERLTGEGEKILALNTVSDLEEGVQQLFKRMTGITGARRVYPQLEYALNSINLGHFYDRFLIVKNFFVSDNSPIRFGNIFNLYEAGAKAAREDKEAVDKLYNSEYSPPIR
jgi:hypothetical protein